MLTNPTLLLALVLLCGVGQPGASAADEARFIGQFPQGIVEPVAITYWQPTKQSQWWRPDGLPTTIGPFLPERPDRMPGFTARVHGVDGKQLTCLVRFANLPADASSALCGFNSSTTLPWFGQIAAWGQPWRASLDGSYVVFGAHGRAPGTPPYGGLTGRSPLIAGSTSWCEANSSRVLDGHRALAQNQVYSSKPAATDRTYPYADGKTVPEYYKMFYLNVLASAPTTDLRVGVSMGAWETVMTQKPARAGRQTFTRDGEEWTVTFRDPKATAAKSGETLVRHTMPRGRLAVRLVAIADDGTEHIPYEVPGAEGSGVVCCGRVPSSTKEFRFQVRPYHWVEFQNISLQPGWKTGVQVVSLKEF